MVYNGWWKWISKKLTNRNLNIIRQLTARQTLPEMETLIRLSGLAHQYFSYFHDLSVLIKCKLVRLHIESLPSVQSLALFNEVFTKSGRLPHVGYSASATWAKSFKTRLSFPSWMWSPTQILFNIGFVLQSIHWSEIEQKEWVRSARVF